MHTFPIVRVSSRFVKDPRRRLCISRADVDSGLLSIRIFKSRHGRGLPTYHIYKGEKVLFTGKIEDIQTLVDEMLVDYTLIDGKLSGYHIYISALVPVTKE